MAKNHRLDHSLSLATLAILIGAALCGTVAHSQEPIEARADDILRAMGDYLSSAEEFRFQASVTYDEFLGLQMVQYGGEADITVRRPGRLRVEYSGDERQNSVVYDGEAMTLFHAGKNLYATIEVDSGIDDAVDRVFELSGFSVPVADLVYADPYAVLVESAETGLVVGRHAVDGTPCHHLAFSQEALDWQIWIEDGPRPVPRKLVITYKNEPGSPQYVARLSGWDFHPQVADGFFAFEPPAGADQVEFLPPAERVEEEDEEVEP